MESTTIMILLIFIAIMGWITIWAVSEQLRSLMSKLLEKTRVVPAIAHDRLIRTFRNQVIGDNGGKSTNPHKNSAAIRTAAVGFIRTINLKLGVLESSVSMSTRDQRDGVAGTRHFYWAKDADKQVCNDTSGALSYVDVDYHIDDLESTLAGRTNHTLIFTIIPTKAAHSAETSHTFDNSGNIVVDMVGGGHYCHQLWDWNSDTITCSKRFFGIPYSTTIYKVEKRNIDELKGIVLLAPIGKWTGLSAIFAAGLQSDRLQRLNCVADGFAHVRYITPEGLYHSIAATGTNTEARLTAGEYDTMYLAAKAGKKGPTVSSMATWCDNDRIRAAITASYFDTVTVIKAPLVTLTAEAVASVSANVANHGDSPERVSVQAFMQPVVAGNCYAHTDHPDNAKWAAEARITSLRVQKVQRLNPFVAACIKEFVTLAFPSTLCRADLETVYEKQNRPLQREIIAEAVSMGPSERTSLKAFLKKEAYAGAKDPRIITTYRPGTKVGYSVYMYALTLQMKEHAWYGFKTPEEIAARVAAICCNSEYIVEGDFSRMDGRIDSNVREAFEKAILHTAFPNDEEVQRLHDLQYNQTVSLDGGSYQQGTARGSGSPETSVFNTALTGFIMYLTSRLLQKAPTEAFACIGVVAGDDSLQGGDPSIPAGVFGGAMVRASRQMGQLLTSETKLLGDPVSFLARIFGGAWHGDMNSMASPLRLLSKVHCCVNLGEVSPEDKCREKGESILSGDGNTPIIGELAKKMTSIGCRMTGENRYRIVNWWSKFDECSWPNEYADWMESVIHSELPDFDYALFEEWCLNGDPLLAPTCMTVIPKQHAKPLLVNGELESSTTSSASSSTGSVRK